MAFATSTSTLGQRLIALCALCCLCAANAVAAEPTAAERETARALMEDGDRARAAGDLQTALARYGSAHAIMHVPTTGLALAQTQAQLGLLVEARSSAIEVVNMPRAAAEPKVFSEARRTAAELARSLEPRVPSLTTHVNPPGVAYTLTIDGVKLPAAVRDVPFKTNPGLRSVLIEAPGYASQLRQVVLVEGKTRLLSVTLTPVAQAQPGRAPPPNSPPATSRPLPAAHPVSGR